MLTINEMRSRRKKGPHLKRKERRGRGWSDREEEAERIRDWCTRFVHNMVKERDCLKSESVYAFHSPVGRDVTVWVKKYYELKGMGPSEGTDYKSKSI